MPVVLCDSGLAVFTKKFVDTLAGKRPIIVEIGNDGLHERFREPDGPFLVAEMIEENGESKLLRALALVGPFEAILGKALHLVMLVERLAVGGNHKAIDRAPAFIDCHAQTDTV